MTLNYFKWHPISVFLTQLEELNVSSHKLNGDKWIYREEAEFYTIYAI
jgi:hypothetical protein